VKLSPSECEQQSVDHFIKKSIFQQKSIQIAPTAVATSEKNKNQIVKQINQPANVHSLHHRQSLKCIIQVNLSKNISI